MIETFRLSFFDKNGVFIGFGNYLWAFGDNGFRQSIFNNILWLIIVPSLSYKGTPYSWGTYMPRWPEVVILASSFAAMALFYLLFSKFIPIISIWEMKVGEHTDIKIAAHVQEAEAAGELP